METLDQYLEGRKAKGFTSVPHYFRDGDFVSFFLSDERCYSERVDDLLTVYLSEKTGEMVGCKVKGVRLLLETLDAFSVTIDDGRVRLSWLFLSAAAHSDARSRDWYRSLADAARGLFLDREEIAQAA